MLVEELILKMVEFDKGDPKRIQHFMKVYEFAHIIGVKENIDENTLFILDIASIMHDIGIHPAEVKYGSANGKLQEQEGPAYAGEMLAEFQEISPEQIERVCYLIGHHHTYENVEGIDYRILLEADFLVNALEDNLNRDAIIQFRDKIFETQTGVYLLNTMFGL
ncbi:MAG: HD domain-containing protein [Lachnospiraceae bacterium]|nr:HD domain-containing protein [Lachnospiraceae bacterium]